MFFERQYKACICLRNKNDRTFRVFLAEYKKCVQDFYLRNTFFPPPHSAKLSLPLHNLGAVGVGGRENIRHLCRKAQT